MSQIPHPSTLTRLTTPPSLPGNAHKTLEIIELLEKSDDLEEKSLNDRLQEALIKGLTNIQDDRMGNPKFSEIEAIRIAPTAADSAEANATTATWAEVYSKQFKPINRWQTEQCEQLNTKTQSIFSNLTLEQRLERLGLARSPNVIYDRGDYDLGDDGDSSEEGNSLSGAGTSLLVECNDPIRVCIESGKNKGPIFQPACSPPACAYNRNSAPKKVTFNTLVTIRTESPLNDQSKEAIEAYHNSEKEVITEGDVEFLVEYTTFKSETSRRGPIPAIIGFFKGLFRP
jgi:hypothetical protein